MTNANLAVNITGNATNLKGVMGTLGGALKDVVFGMNNLSTAGNIGMGALKSGAVSAGGAFAKIGVAALIAGAGIAIGIGVTTTKMAADFQTGITSLSTGAGEAQSNLKMVGDGILGLATTTGTSTKQLIDGMYMIESSGYHGAAGLAVLRVAAEGAKVGSADLGTVANALTTILTDYHMKGTQAAQAMNALTATVASGKTKLQDLSSAMGAVLPLASSLGLSFPQVAGGIATMTNAGMSAQNASQNLANAIRSLAAPNAAAQKSMASVGMTAQQLKDTLSSGGLTAAIQSVEDHVGNKFPAGSVQAVEAFKKIMGGATGYNVALMLGGKNMSTYEGNVATITSAMKHGGDTVVGWSQVQGTFNQQMSQAKEAVEVLGIKVGQALLPTVTNLMSKIAPLITQFSDWLVKSGTLQNVSDALANGLAKLGNAIGTVVTIGANLVSFFQHNQVAMDLLLGVGAAVAVFIGVALVSAFVAWAIAAGSAAIATLAATWPILAIGALIALVVGGIILAVQHWGQIIDWLKGVWQGISSWFQSTLGGIGSFFTGLWNGIKSATENVWNGLGSWLHSTVGNIGNFFTTTWGNVKTGTTNAWNTITNGIKSGVSTGATWLKDTWQKTATSVVDSFSWLYNHNYYFKDLVNFIVNTFNTFKTWITTFWNDEVQGWTNIWNKVKSIATSLWNDVKTVFTTALSWLTNLAVSFWNYEVQGWTNIWNKIKAIVTPLWNDVKALFSAAFDWIAGIAVTFWNDEVQGWTNIWNRVKSIVTSLWNDVTSIFSNAWSGLSGALSGLWSNISNWFNNLIGQMTQFGQRMIQGFIDGITSMLGAVGNAASNVASKVASFLGFHSPTREGPGAELNIWGPNMVKGFASGIDQSAPLVAASVAHLMSITGQLGLSPTSASGIYPRTGTSGMPSTSSASTSGGDDGMQTIELHVDSQKITSVVGKRLYKNKRLYLGDRSVA